MANNDAATTVTRDSERYAKLVREIRELRGKITLIDGLTQEVAASIDALAKGAQATLLAGDDLRVVHRLLGAICEAADDHMNLVNVEAERVDANRRVHDDPGYVIESAIYSRWRVTNAATEEMAA